MSPRPGPSERGFTLIEVLVATLVLVVGLMALVQLLVVSTMMHHDSRQASDTTLQARTTLEELMKLDFTSAAVQITGANTLERNLPNYFDEPSATITRRWQVLDGPAPNTRLVTVRVVNRSARRYGREAELTTLIREW